MKMMMRRNVLRMSLDRRHLSTIVIRESLSVSHLTHDTDPENISNKFHTSLSSVVDHNNAQEEREVHLRVCNCVVLYVGSFQNCKLASFFVLLIMKRPFAPNAFS